LALFAQDLVDFVIGKQWDEAVLVLGAFGIFEAINAVGSNWTAFMRATGRTRPLAVVSVVGMATFVLATPLLFIFEMPGFVAMVGITAGVALAQRLYYLATVFPGFGFIGQALRGFAPVVPSALAVLGMRLVLEGDRTAGTAALELSVFLVVTAIATYALERPLLREAMGYLRRRSAAPQAA
jgi:O-antigen/teichoic acid export membrane protein